MCKMTCEQIVEVPLVKAIQTECEVVQIGMHLVFGPEEIRSVEEGIKSYDDGANISIWHFFTNRF
jgi:hypothetical protein